MANLSFTIQSPKGGCFSKSILQKNIQAEACKGIIPHLGGIVKEKQIFRKGRVKSGRPANKKSARPNRLWANHRLIIWPHRIDDAAAGLAACPPHPLPPPRPHAGRRSVDRRTDLSITMLRISSHFFHQLYVNCSYNFAIIRCTCHSTPRMRAISSVG